MTCFKQAVYGFTFCLKHNPGFFYPT